jgi:hypothetical protein
MKATHQTKMRIFAKSKNKQDHQFTEAGSDKLMVKGKGDAFWLGNHKMQILNHKLHEGDAAKQVARRRHTKPTHEFLPNRKHKQDH